MWGSFGDMYVIYFPLKNVKRCMKVFWGCTLHVEEYRLKMEIVHWEWNRSQYNTPKTALHHFKCINQCKLPSAVSFNITSTCHRIRAHPWLILPFLFSKSHRLPHPERITFIWKAFCPFLSSFLSRCSFHNRAFIYPFIPAFLSGRYLAQNLHFNYKACWTQENQ